MPRLQVVCGGKALENALGQPETDDGTRFEVRRVGPDEWHATFFPAESARGRAGCVIQVLRTGAGPVSSAEFKL
jgi:hypothetical protein